MRILLVDLTIYIGYNHCRLENIGEKDMRPQDIVLETYYRHRQHPTYTWIKPLEILRPENKNNPHTYTIIKCELTIGKCDDFGKIIYLRPSDLIISK